MSKKLLTLLTVSLTGLLLLAVGVLVAADVPAVITIENTGYKTDKKGPVVFDHKKHNVDYKIACKECHHEYFNGANVWKEGDPVKPCKTCHNPLKKGGDGALVEIPKLQNAFHKKCKDCHKELAKEGKKTGPFKKCTECHQKKS